MDVVIVSFRCEALLRRCLASLEANPTLRRTNVHVVDNASSDGTAEMVEREFPWASLTRAERNLGFSAANNLAIRQGSAPYVLVLNPDTEVRAGTLDRLSKLMDERPEIGICGPKLVCPDGQLDHAAKRSFPTVAGALGHFAGVGGRDRADRLSQYCAPELDAEQSGPVDAVNGAFMLIRRQALEEVGSFDEGYWMYMEDLDLCYRFARSGWITWYEPSAVALHVKGGTSGPVRSARLAHAFHYGMHRFYRKHYAHGRPRLINAAVYSGIWAKLAGALVASPIRRSLRGASAGTGAESIATVEAHGPGNDFGIGDGAASEPHLDGRSDEQPVLSLRK